MACDAVAARQRQRADNGADADTGQHWPQAPQQRAQFAAGETLPNIGRERGHHQDGCRLRRRHHQPEQSDRHRRQTHADHAFDESRKQVSASNGSQKLCFHPASLLQGGRPCAIAAGATMRNAATLASIFAKLVCSPGASMSYISGRSGAAHGRFRQQGCEIFRRHASHRQPWRAHQGPWAAAQNGRGSNGLQRQKVHRIPQPGHGRKRRGMSRFAALFIARDLGHSGSNENQTRPGRTTT